MKRAGGGLQLNAHAHDVLTSVALHEVVHGCMMYTERARMAAVSHGTSHVSAVSTPLWWIFKNML